MYRYNGRTFTNEASAIQAQQADFRAAEEARPKLPSAPARSPSRPPAQQRSARPPANGGFSSPDAARRYQYTMGLGPFANKKTPGSRF